MCAYFNVLYVHAMQHSFSIVKPGNGDSCMSFDLHSQDAQLMMPSCLLACVPLHTIYLSLPIRTLGT